MKYTIYTLKECSTCDEFIRLFNEARVDLTIKDIKEKVGWEDGKYRWEQIDLTEEFGVPGSFVPMVLIEKDNYRKLFAGGKKGEEKEDVEIFESHEDGIDKLSKILNIK